MTPRDRGWVVVSSDVLTPIERFSDEQSAVERALTLAEELTIFRHRKVTLRVERPAPAHGQRHAA